MTIRELVAEIRLRKANVDDPTLMVLWYLMRAFCLRLTDVLPVRNWLAGAAKDEETDSLILPRIKSARGKWWPTSNGSTDQGASETMAEKHGLPIVEQRS